MHLKFILKMVIFFYFVINTPVFGEEALILPVIEGSHSVGNDQNNLGINAYKKGKFNQALRHFQVASVVDRKKGEIFFNLGITLHQLGNHLEAAKHFQWALKLSPENKRISESALLKEHHCKSNPKIPCDLKKPEKHKTEGSDTITTPNYMPSYGGSGY
ncbi:MAG: tetratricopeptide repeat protein [Nitrospinae bacterium]|nr:tetratricopeptide repeat protein [Nitrospinota bacterium]